MKNTIFQPEIAADGWYVIQTPYNADFQADLKAIPGYARRWDKEAKTWRIAPLWWPCAADFIYSHFGVDLTPERGPYPTAGKMPEAKPAPKRESPEQEVISFAPKAALPERGEWVGGK